MRAWEGVSTEYPERSEHGARGMEVGWSAHVSAEHLVRRMIELHPMGDQLTGCGIEQDGGTVLVERGANVPQARTIGYI